MKLLYERKICKKKHVFVGLFLFFGARPALKKFCYSNVDPVYGTVPDSHLPHHHMYIQNFLQQLF